jgi:hypothetical protein|tara:strand:- start:160 stop:375 length:216 start_codon:yes stop_codon:yes gene_type:complete
MRCSYISKLAVLEVAPSRGNIGRLFAQSDDPGLGAAEEDEDNEDEDEDVDDDDDDEDDDMGDVLVVEVKQL